VPHELIGRCPVCSESMEAVRLACPSCGTAIEGRFILGRFQRLSSDQLQFIETFIRCRGVIKDVEEQLGISYPTVRGRLDAVIRALGYDVPEDTTAVDRRREMLESVRNHTLTVEEADRLLRTSVRKGA